MIRQGYGLKDGSQRGRKEGGGRRNQNTEPCETGGPGSGAGAGRGGGRNRRDTRRSD